MSHLRRVFGILRNDHQAQQNRLRRANRSRLRGCSRGPDSRHSRCAQTVRLISLIHYWEGKSMTRLIGFWLFVLALPAVGLGGDDPKDPKNWTPIKIPGKQQAPEFEDIAEW